MMRLLSLLVLFVFVESTQAKSYFEAHGDMCDNEEKHTECTNDSSVVKKLQIILNKDKKLHVKLKEDGKWGKETKEAVVAFQKKHKLLHADGWVGKETKVLLDKMSQKIKSSKKKKLKKITPKKPKNYATYKEFAKNVNLRKSFQVFKNKKLIAKANPRNTRLKIDVSEQRIKLLVHGKVALSAPCTTGSRHKIEPNTRTYRDKHTPFGTFRIMEKIAAKKSTIFGDMYRHGRRVYHGDRRKYRGPRARYVGHTMHNWMRLTSGGIGLHASKYVKRYPGSNGCVRLQPAVARLIFRKVRRGTKVSVVH